MKIAVIGVGGVGGYYGGLLARRGHQVTFLARGAHLEAMQKNGLRVHSSFGDFVLKPVSATGNPDDVGVVDLILFCTKTYSMDQAARSAKPLVGGSTIILSLQNGVEAPDRIGSILGGEHMLAGATWLSSSLTAPGMIQQVSEYHRVVMGELHGRLTDRLRGVVDAFAATGVTTEASQNIEGVLWTKLVFISAAAGFGSVTRLPIAAYRGVSETRRLIVDLMRETASVAAANGVKLGPDVVDQALDTMDRAGPDIKTSMQLDVEAGRPTELDSLIGVICRKGRAHGIATPMADMLYGLLLPLELNTGPFLPPGTAEPRVRPHA